MNKKGAKHFEIWIDYQLNDSLDWHHVQLTPEQYFELDPSEQPSLESSVDRYNNTVEYLNIPARKVRATRLVVHDIQSDSRKEITEFFWNEGENQLVERRDFFLLKETYREIIQTIKTGDDPITWDIVRIRPVENFLMPVFHSRIVDNPDGSQSETVFLSTSKK